MQLRNRNRIALLAAFALGIHSIESLVPTPFPWLRLGFANIITLVTLILYGFYPAAMVTLIRVVLGSLFSGTFLGPGFLLSLGGGVASILSMGIIIMTFPRLFSAVGLSIIGAMTHNIGQLIIAYFFFVQRIEAILLIAPLIVLLGTLTGTFNGFVSELLVRNLQKSGQTIQNVT